MFCAQNWLPFYYYVLRAAFQTQANEWLPKDTKNLWPKNGSLDPQSQLQPVLWGDHNALLQVHNWLDASQSLLGPAGVPCEYRKGWIPTIS